MQPFALVAMAWSTSAEGQAVLRRLREDDRTLTKLDLKREHPAGHVGGGAACRGAAGLACCVRRTACKRGRAGVAHAWVRRAAGARDRGGDAWGTWA